MKRNFIVFLTIAAITAGLVGCNSKKCQPTEYKATVETLGGTDAPMAMDATGRLATWEDALVLTDASITGVDEKGVYTIVRNDTTAPSGVVRMVYPYDAATDAEHVTIGTKQIDAPIGSKMVLYGETVDGKGNNIDMKAVCGVVKMHIITPEMLDNIVIRTEDSNRYMSGVFAVSNYPFPVLNATEQSAREVMLTGTATIDFKKGADVCFYVAPGCYGTFTVVMTTVDGRVCTKNLKEGKEVVVDRNRVCNIQMGVDGSELVFE
ncbi:MAG: hypothetical protein J5641_05480 [Bacteroidales bacterium]|nr:hypothetical protein [Bacteroidales bacterium]